MIFGSVGGAIGLKTCKTVTLIVIGISLGIGEEGIGFFI